MLDKKEVGFFIQTKRKENKLTQQDLASKTGLSRNYISDVENGRYTPSAESLFKIAIVLDIDLNKFKMTEIH